MAKESRDPVIESMERGFSYRNEVWPGRSGADEEEPSSM